MIDLSTDFSCALPGAYVISTDINPAACGATCTTALVNKAAVNVRRCNFDTTIRHNMLTRRNTSTEI